jgi:precorrin-6B methylase 2
MAGDSGLEERIATLQAPELYLGLEGMARFNAVTAAADLIKCAELELLDLDATQRIVDFGAGRGGPTFALGLLAKENGGQVDAVELEEPRGREIERTGQTRHLNVRLHIANGLKWLGDQSMAGKKYDLITAFMLGPDKEGRLSKALLDAAQCVLAPEGKVFIASDDETMAAANEVCAASGYHGYAYIKRDEERDMLVVPSRN